MNILIAEDDLTCRHEITKLLSNYGHCEVTVDGIEVIELFVNKLDSGISYDLICLDVMMPKLDGIKVLRKIREWEDSRKIEKSKRAKIIVTTALGETHYIMSALEAGMEAYVCKPIEKSNIEEAMKRLGLTL